jgi:hypothetical protein
MWFNMYSLPQLVELIEPRKHNRCLEPAGVFGGKCSEETLMSDETETITEADCVLCSGLVRWSRLSEHFLRIDKWSICRGLPRLMRRAFACSV